MPADTADDRERRHGLTAIAARDDNSSLKRALLRACGLPVRAIRCGAGMFPPVI